MAEEAGASARYLMGEGGFLSALWKMAEASGAGLSADLRSVPIRQETIEICEIFDVNPYKTPFRWKRSSGESRVAMRLCRNCEEKGSWQQ